MILCDMKDTLKDINGRLDTVEDNIQLSNMKHREKKNQNFSEAALGCRTTLHSLVYG